MIRFWRKFAKKIRVKRRQRMLAEVMGNYAIKARIFARIKLHNQNVKRIERVVGSLHPRVRYFKLAGTHLREYYRLHSLRTFYHRQDTDRY